MGTLWSQINGHVPAHAHTDGNTLAQHTCMQGCKFNPNTFAELGTHSSDDDFTTDDYYTYDDQAHAYTDSDTIIQFNCIAQQMRNNYFAHFSKCFV